MIITTHYISEANDANSVAFMKLGKVIRQDSPQNLFQQLNVSTLEQAFLKLCKTNVFQNKIEKNEINYLDNLNERSKESEFKLREKVKFKSLFIQKLKRIKAHVWKNFVTERNLPILIFLKLTLTLLQFLLFPKVFGGLATDLSVDILNFDNNLISKEVLEHVDQHVFILKNADLKNNLIDLFLNGGARSDICL